MTTRREITLDNLKSLQRGDAIHLPASTVAFPQRDRDRSGAVQRWRVNGAVKTWKRDPSRVRVPLKFGLYAYDAVTEDDIDRLRAQGAFIDRY